MSNPVYYGYQKHFDSRGVSAEVAYKELTKIKRKRGGELGADDVLESARSKSSPIHPIIFDRSQKAAAESYYRDRAGKLIRNIVVAYEEAPDIEERAFSVTYEMMDEDSNRKVGVYASTDEILADPEAREQLLRRALREANSWRQRYKRLTELADVFAALENVGS